VRPPSPPLPPAPPWEDEAWPPPPPQEALDPARAIGPESATRTRNAARARGGEGMQRLLSTGRAGAGGSIVRCEEVDRAPKWRPEVQAPERPSGASMGRERGKGRLTSPPCRGC